ncbi:MAG: acyl-ACP--UDP-N-acetylglucosamine O-acyltransferase [Candidatus Rokuibacteriota bacterium]
MTEGIHPTALVDTAAQLGAGVTIGAFTVVGPEVTLGDGVEIGHHVVLEGRVEIGARAKLGHGSVLGGLPQDLKFKPGTPSGVRVGAGTAIREYVTIHRATTPEAWTQIGEGCLIMAMAHVAHDCRVGDGAIVINYAGITGHCEIGERATVGGLSGMLPFTRVGAYAYIGGASKVTHDVPPFTIVDGNPASAHAINVVGLRRAGIPPAERALLREAYRLLYRRGLPPPAAIARIRAELPATGFVKQLTEFVEASRRGICPAAEERGTGPVDGDAGGEEV